MTPPEADPFGVAKKPVHAPAMQAAGAPAMVISGQPREVAEEVARQAALRRVDKAIEHLMRARYPLIYILSSEEKRVEKSIADVLHSREAQKNYKTKIYTWSVTEGVRVGGEPQGDSKDPLKALRFILEAKKDERAVFILRDLHAFQKNPEVVRLLRDLRATSRRRSRPSSSSRRSCRSRPSWTRKWRWSSTRSRSCPRSGPSSTAS